MSASIDTKRIKGLLGERFQTDYPLSPFTSLRIGGFAEYWVQVDNFLELEKIIDLTKEEGLPLRVMGGGTNLVITRGILKGFTIHLKGHFAKIKRVGEFIDMGAGCELALLIKEVIKGDLSGAEGIVGIPGTLGGGIKMNAGTKVGSLGDLVDEMMILSLEKSKVYVRNRKDARFSYRSGPLNAGEILLEARLKMAKGDEIKRHLKEILSQRIKNQPYRKRTAGCVFKNPEGESAGKLIEMAGMMGYRYGRIEVSRKHANFFVNLGGGTAEEFIELMDIVRGQVERKLSVILEPEVEIWQNRCDRV